MREQEGNAFLCFVKVLNNEAKSGIIFVQSVNPAGEHERTFRCKLPNVN